MNLYTFYNRATTWCTLLSVSLLVTATTLSLQDQTIRGWPRPELRSPEGFGCLEPCIQIPAESEENNKFFPLQNNVEYANPNSWGRVTQLHINKQKSSLKANVVASPRRKVCWEEIMVSRSKMSTNKRELALRKTYKAFSSVTFLKSS